MAKLERMYGLKKAMLIYIVFSTGASAAIILVFNILVIINTVTAVVYMIISGVFSIIYFHYVIKKAIK